MRLQRENNQSSEYNYLRGKTVLRIVGTEDQAELIEKIDTLIGAEVKCFDGNNKPCTWKQECSDDCADYVYGSGCGWIVDHEDVEEFKNLWKKFKKVK